ncbi:MAG: hypothetical protein ACLQBY_04040 [Solirubrobacteraceae bacterium]
MQRRGAEWRRASVVGLAGAIALGVLSAPIRKEGTPRGDDLIYEDIARHPFGVHTFPFGFRLGLPLAVHWLPFDHTVSFSGLALLAAGGAAAFAYLLMRELGGERRVASALAVLMSVSPPFLIVALRHGRNPDIATVFFMMAATYFAVRRQRWPLAVALLLGVVVREAVLFVVPLAYALWAVRPLDRRAALDSLAVAAPAIAAYAAIRLGISTVGEAQVPGYAGSLIGERFTVVKLGLQSAFREARRMFTVYGPLWLVAPLALRDMRFARRGLVLVALALLSMTFALDWGRMILLAAPAFYPASAYVLGRRPSWTRPVLATFLLLAIGYAVYMDVSGVKSGIIDNPPPPYPVQ